MKHTHAPDDADIPTEVVAAVSATFTKAGAIDPVVCAAVERETNPALVAVARAGGQGLTLVHFLSST